MSSEKVVLIGGGGHCKSVLDSIRQSGKFSDIVITDHQICTGTEISGYKVVGNDEMLFILYKRGYQHAFITVGSIKSTACRRNIYERAKGIGFSFPFVIDMTATVAGSARVGDGVFIGKNSVVNTDAVISDFAIINTGAIIEHDSSVGEFSHIAVGAVICGGAEIGDDVFIGANATVIQGIKIGMSSVIGAGSIILADVPENTTVMGVWG